jgi:bacillithiol system protein YtxJ
MNQFSPHWKSINSLSELDLVVDDSRQKPALVLKHKSNSRLSTSIKATLEETWSISPEMVDVFLVDDLKHNDVSKEVSELAGIDSETPQVVLFADGVTMYDESGDMISVKKIKLALKIVNRTFRWMETRA